MLATLLILTFSPGKLSCSQSSQISYDDAVTGGLRSRRRGELVAAEKSFRQALFAARAANRKDQEGGALLKIAGCQLRACRYRDAMVTIGTLSALADQIHDVSLAGAAENDRATIYQQLGDYRAAEGAIRRAIPLLRQGRQDYLCIALQNEGEIKAGLHKLQESAALYRESLALARHAGFMDLEVSALSYLAGALLDRQDLAAAEQILHEAKDIETREGNLDALSNTLANLAYLASKKAEFGQALRLLDAASLAGGNVLSTVPPYWVPNLRGEILLGLHRYSEALYNFRKSVRAANASRMERLPGDETRTHNVVVLHTVYENYVELAAQMSLSRGDVALSTDAFRVLVEDRASSLREQMASQRHKPLPIHYYELLGQLQQALSNADNPDLQRIRSELSDLENRITLDEGEVPRNKLDTESSNAVLRKIQRKLRKSDLLLTYCLGKTSFVWAVSSDGPLRLYKLAPGDEIERRARAFYSSTQDNLSDSGGLSLAIELFGQLPRELAQKPEWIIAPDGGLLDNFPFSALPDVANQTDMPLVEKHAVRILPSALFLDLPSLPAPKGGGFLGYGDPVYNKADARANTILWTGHANSPTILARLVGSGREIVLAAQASAMSTTRIVTGTAVNKRDIRASLAQPPRVLHFAVHVVSPPTSADNSGDAALALSLGPDGSPELLTKEDIATLHVPGTLIVLSGCKSAQGDNLPSAGIIGLSRSWLVAGASAVIVTAWPTPDDTGDFFVCFYRHLIYEPDGNPGQAAADALRSAQIEMQRSTTYRQRSSFWAAYSLVSRE